MIKATVNQGKTYTITQEKHQTLVNEQPFSWDLVKTGTDTFHIIHQHQSYSIEVLEADYAQKKFLLKINHTEITVDLQDELDVLIKKLGIEEQTATGNQSIKAPMPGLILDINVSAGDNVEEGSPLLTLEAMKMENVIKAPHTGKVKVINVNQGESVTKNQVLIEMV